MLYICKNVHRADLLLVYKTTLLAYKHCFISFKTACLTRSESKIQTAVIAFLKILNTTLKSIAQALLSRMKIVFS